MTREEAIIVMENEMPHCGEKLAFTEEEKCEAFNTAIEALSDWKKGEWKRNITAERDAQLIFTKVYNCSECGYESVGNNLKNFCPNCGADMRGDVDD